MCKVDKDLESKESKKDDTLIECKPHKKMDVIGYLLHNGYDIRKIIKK